MKINGTKLYKPSSQLIVFTRGDDPAIKLEVIAVLDRAEFDKLCPTPVPPMMMKRGEGKVPDFDDKGFLAQVQRNSELYTKWICLKSIMVPSDEVDGEPTHVEWETIDLQDPKTWNNYDQELIASGFSDMERLKLQNVIFEVNSLSETKAREARETFLQWRRDKQLASISQGAEQPDTNSGELVNVSVSVLPK